MKQNAKIQGFSLVELMVTMTILAMIMGGVYMAMYAGKDTWAYSDTRIGLRENLRRTLEKVSRELRETGSTGGVMQLTITNGGGVANSDLIRFSIPVLCQIGASVINATGDVSYWRAPLTWGCTASSCMDADNDCNTVDYRYVQYQMNGANQLLRQVLDNNAAVIRQDIFGESITDFQATLSADQNVVTLTVTVAGTTTNNRLLTTTQAMDVYLRNRS